MAPAAASPELIARARQLLADGASYREAARSVGLDAATLRRYLPGYGWSAAQGGALGRARAGHA